MLPFSRSSAKMCMVCHMNQSLLHTQDQLRAYVTCDAISIRLGIKVSEVIELSVGFKVLKLLSYTLILVGLHFTLIFQMM